MGQRNDRAACTELIRNVGEAVAQSRGRKGVDQPLQTGAPTLHLHRDVDVLRSAGRAAHRNRVRTKDEPAEAVTVEHPGDRGECVSERRHSDRHAYDAADHAHTAAAVRASSAGVEGGVVRQLTTSSGRQMAVQFFENEASESDLASSADRPDCRAVSRRL